MKKALMKDRVFLKGYVRSLHLGYLHQRKKGMYSEENEPYEDYGIFAYGETVLLFFGQQRDQLDKEEG